MASKLAAPFKMGKKPIYLPGSVYTLVRGSGKLPANQAMFHVPLNTNKFDVRDYLYNLYGLVTTNVKAMVQLSPLQQGTVSQRAKRLHWRRKLQLCRPQSIKKVIVTMNEPFKYPEPPKDLEPWNVTMHKVQNDRAKWGRRGITRRGGTKPWMVNGRVR